MTKMNIQRQHNVNSDDAFLNDIYLGFGKKQKSLPCKYFYDERGSILFDKICQTEDYYHTRTELNILDEALPTVANVIGPHADILEFGSGAGIKIRKLIDALDKPSSYCPIDISEAMLQASAQALQATYPDLVIYPIVADYLSPIHLHHTFTDNTANKKLVFFPGSTISNFDMTDAMQFLKRIRNLLNPGDGLLIGVDLIKPLPKLLAAYNDREGITAEFNLNVLDRITRAYETNLNRNNFFHRAMYNDEKSRIEMHLVSKCFQRIYIEDEVFLFDKGETIHTENSYKFSIENFKLMGINAGFVSNNVFTDDEKLFSVHLLLAE